MAAIEEYDWAGLGKGLEEVAKPFHVELLRLAVGEASRVLPVGVSWSQSNPRVKETIKGLGKQIRGVSDTMRENVQRVIDAGLERGDSMQTIAKALREYGVTDSESRSMLIARTETAVAYNQGAVLAYAEAGVSKVRVLDGDGDEECAAANGQIWTLAEAEANPIAHPGCVRAFAPVVE